jgi:hypothetical protein
MAYVVIAMIGKVRKHRRRDRGPRQCYDFVVRITVNVLDVGSRLLLTQRLY